MLTRMKFLSDDVLKTLGSRLYSWKITPNKLSVAGFIFMGIAGILIYQERILLCLLFVFFGASADVLDGIVARSSGSATLRGGFLDSMIDRYSDMFLIGGMLLGGWLGGLKWDFWEWPPISDISGEFWALGALSGALLTSYSRAAAERLGVKQEGIGLIERPERMVILFLGLLAGQATLTLAVLTILGHVTVVQRCVHFWNNAPAIEKEKGSEHDK